MVIQERDRVIKELEEKVAFLEAEVSARTHTLSHIYTHMDHFSCVFITLLNHLFIQNRELHDQMDYFLNGQRSNSGLFSDSNAQIVYR